MQIKVRAIQMQVLPKQVKKNAEKVISEIAKAAKEGIELLIFPELCLSGYLIGDFWDRPAFLKECEYWGSQIILATKELLAPTVIFGTVITDWDSCGEDGRVLKYNAFLIAQNGQTIRHPALNVNYGIKTLLPNYREFDESRYFFDTRKLALEKKVSVEDLIAPVEIIFGNGSSAKKICCGIMICEDSWDEDYSIKPASILVAKGCDILINLSCSPFTQGKNQKRNRLFSASCKQHNVSLIYLNSIGLQNNGKTIFTFDGNSAVYTAVGEKIFEAPAYHEFCVDLLFSTLTKKITGSIDYPKPVVKSSTEEHFMALQYGIKEFLKQIKLSKIVIGASGGIDSAVCAALYGTILPKENIILVNMPSRFNSTTTKNLAKELADNLGCLYGEVPIDESVALTKKQMDDLELSSVDGKISHVLHLTDFQFENLQARDRSSRILAAIAAAFNGVFTCNANKTEAAIGYSTLYGDLGGFLAVLGDLWKADVYELGRYLNTQVYKKQIIPQGVFDIVPSAELSLAQAVDEGKGDPLIYPYHDKLFHAFMQKWNPATPEELLNWYAEGSLNKNLNLQDLDAYQLFPSVTLFIEDLEKYWRLLNTMAVAKRIQAPPIIAVSQRCFGFDYRESQDEVFFSTAYIKHKEHLLNPRGVRQ